MLLIQQRRLSRGLPTLPDPIEGQEERSELYLQASAWLPIIRRAGIKPEELEAVHEFALLQPRDAKIPFGAEDVARAYAPWKESKHPSKQPYKQLQEKQPTKEEILEGVAFARQRLAEIRSENYKAKMGSGS